VRRVAKRDDLGRKKRSQGVFKTLNMIVISRNDFDNTRYLQFVQSPPAPHLSFGTTRPSNNL
jgi:hypothetical protein